MIKLRRFATPKVIASIVAAIVAGGGAGAGAVYLATADHSAPAHSSPATPSGKAPATAPVTPSPTATPAAPATSYVCTPPETSAEGQVRSLLAAAKAEGGRAIKDAAPRSGPFFYTPRANAGDPGENTITDSAPGVAEIYTSDKELTPSQLDRVAAAVTLNGTVKPGCVRTETWETDPADNSDGEFRFTFTVTTTDGKIVKGTAGGTAAKIDTLTWGHTGE